jgi:hypothetical protein
MTPIKAVRRVATGGCLIAVLYLTLAGEGRAQAPTPKAEPQIYKIRCDQPQNHDEADLCEQRRQAQAAEDAVWWAAFQSKLGIAGFAAVVFSLVFTGWAAVAASRAAKAAESAIHKDRAWLCSSGFIIAEMTDGKVNDRTYREAVGCFPEWRNAGATPAMEALLLAVTKVVPRGSPVPHFEPPSRGEGPAKTAMVGPGQGFRGPLLPLALDNDLQKFRQREIDVYIYCLVTYRGVFGSEDRRTEVCAMAEYYGEDPRSREILIRFVFVGPQNTAS